MARRRRSSDRGASHPHKAAAEYNLEKEPLHTGAVQPDASLAERGRFLRNWNVRMLSWSGMIVILIALTLLVAVVAEMLGWRLLTRWVSQAE